MQDEMDPVDLDDAPTEDVEGEELPEVAAATPRNLRARAPRPGIKHPVFGNIPAAVDAWRAEKHGMGGQRVVLSYRSPDGQADVTQWPIAELSVETLQKRWGGGTYMITMWRKNGVQFTKRTPDIVIHDPPGGNEAAAAPPPSPTGVAVEEALRLMNAQDARSNSQVANIIALAAAMRGDARGSVDSGELAALRAENARLQQQAAEERMAARLAEMQRDNDRRFAEQQRDNDRRYAELERRREEDERSDLAGDAVAAGARVYRRGMGWGDIIKEMIHSDPSLLKTAFESGAPAVMGIVGSLLEQQKKANAAIIEQQKARTAPPPVVPVRHLRPVRPVVAGADVPTGLNALAKEQADREKREAARSATTDAPASVVSPANTERAS